MRHGQVDTGPGRMFLGQTDLPLDETGKAQARLWQAELAPVCLAGVYVSSLLRARQTSALCCPGRTATVDARLNEIHLGSWDGKRFDHIRRRFPEAFAQRGKDIYRFRTPGGESFQDVGGRAVSFFQDLARQMPGKKKTHTLVITHAGVIRTLCCRWGGASETDFFACKPAHGELWVFDPD